MSVTPLYPRGPGGGRGRSPLVDTFPREIDPADLRPREACQAVVDAMLARYPGQIWVHGGRVVRIDPATGAITPLSNRKWRAMSLHAVVWLEQRGRGNARHQVHIAAPTRVLDDAYHGLEGPVLRGVRWAPWVEADGRLVVKPGYDEATGLLLAWDGPACDPDAVTDEQRGDVFARLLDFQFADAASEVAYMGALVQIVRNLQGSPSPLTLITALEAESAKSMLARIIGAVLLGRVPNERGLPGNPTEQGYTLAAYVREQPPYLWLDNVDTGSTMGGSTLHMSLTAHGAVASRIVGTGAVGEGDPTLMFWLATGNQLDVDAELGRRVQPVALRVRDPRRPFRTPRILEWVLEHRTLVLSVLLRQVLEWHRAGTPAPPRVLPSFERWSDLVGGPVCLGEPHAQAAWLAPSSRPVPQLDRDLVSLCEAWPRATKGDGYQALPPRLVFSLAEGLELPALGEYLGTGPDATRSRRMVTWLKQRAAQERPVLGWRLERRMQGNNAFYLPAPVGPPERGGGGRRDADPPSGRMSGVPPDKPEGPEGPEEIPECAWGGEGIPSPFPPHSLSPTTSGSSGPSGYPHPTYHIPPEENRRDRRGGGVEGEGRVRISKDDPAYSQLCEIAERGIRVAPDLWREVTDAAMAGLATSSDREDADRLKNLRSYAGPIWQQARTGDGRVRCAWELQGPGRLGTVEPALQQVTRKFGVRTAIQPEAHHRFIVGDWRAAHLLIAAGMSRDEALLGELEQGSVYARAAAVWGVDEQRGKVAILATLNGAGPARLGEILGCDEGVARARRQAWLERYPQLRATLRSWHGRTAWRTPLGRLVEMRGDYSAVGWTLQAIEADALRLVMQRLAHPIVLVVHDEVVVEVLEHQAQGAAIELAGHMDRALREVADLRGIIADLVKVEVRRAWRET